MWRKCPNSASLDCIEEVECDPDQVAGTMCQRKEECKSENPDKPECMKLEECTANEPCDGFRFVEAESGWSMQQADVGSRFESCPNNPDCFVREHECVATSGNNLCISMRQGCVASDTQKCFTRVSC